MSESIPVLWDGEIVVAVHKPAGLPTQAAAGIDSLEQRLRRQFASRSSYLALPHRLDRPVSGVVLVALSKRAARLISEQFAAGRVRKTYLAEVQRRVDPNAKSWVDWVRKIDGQAKAEICSEQSDRAKLARTSVEVLRYDEEIQRTRLRLVPETGRMHQLRIQSASRGHVITGDRLYDPTTPPDDAAEIMLQAISLSFYDPRNASQVTVSAATDRRFGR